MCKLKQYMHILIPQLTWLGITKNKITDHYEPNQTIFFFTKVRIAYKTKCKSSALNKQTKKNNKKKTTIQEMKNSGCLNH